MNSAHRLASASSFIYWEVWREARISNWFRHSRGNESLEEEALGPVASLVFHVSRYENGPTLARGFRVPVCWRREGRTTSTKNEESAAPLCPLLLISWQPYPEAESMNVLPNVYMIFFLGHRV